LFSQRALDVKNEFRLLKAQIPLIQGETNQTLLQLSGVPVNTFLLSTPAAFSFALWCLWLQFMYVFIMTLFSQTAKDVRQVFGFLNKQTPYIYDEINKVLLHMSGFPL
jgi:hypothetical protein